MKYNGGEYEKITKKINLNDTTFIFLRNLESIELPIPRIELPVEALVQRLETHTRCKYVVSGATRHVTGTSRDYIPDFPILDSWINEYRRFINIDDQSKLAPGVSFTFQNTLPAPLKMALPSGSMESLKTLRVETQGSFRDLCFPELKELFLLFKASSTADITTATPELCHIVAPNLFHFSVHYDTSPPVMHDLNGLGREITEENVYENLIEDVGYEPAVFELAHTPSLQLNSSPFVPHESTHTHDQEGYDAMDMSFTRNFLTHCYIGVPDCIIDKCDMTQVAVIRMQIMLSPCNKENSLELKAIELQHLVVLLCGEDATMPTLDCPELGNLTIGIHSSKV